MLILKDNNLEIGIYPGRSIEVKNFRARNERSIKWGEVMKSSILRYLTENLMSRLAYELNGYSGMIFNYEQIKEESRPITKVEQPESKPEVISKKPSPKLYLKANEVEEIYGIRTQTLANWRYKRTGPKYYKVGGSVRYKVEDLNNFMEAKKIKLDADI